MPVIEVSARDLLDRVRQMPPDEFDKFIERALSLRAERPTSTLSSEETKLVRRINRGLPVELRKRFDRLARRRKRGTLTADEHRELLQLSHEAENRDADRAAALADLAKLRRVPVRALMEQMGIKAQPWAEVVVTV